MPNTTNFSADFWWKIALSVLASYVIFLQLYHLTHYPLWRDDAFFAIVAKNLVNGCGYCAVFFDEIYKFHHGISSGPLVILPTALLILFFGNQYWVAGLANILLIWALLLTIFFLSADFFKQEKRSIFCFSSLLLTLIFLTGNYGNENADNLILWHALMGEIPAALCIVIAALLLFSPALNRKKILCGALFLGLALVAKTVTIFAVLVIVIAFILRIFHQHNYTKSQKIIWIISALLCVATPLILFELIKLISLGGQKYFDLQLSVAEMYRNNAVVFAQEGFGVLRHLKFFLTFFGIAAFILVPITIYLIYDSFKKNSQLLSLVLILCSAAQAIWWIFYSIYFDRYLATCFFYYFVGLALLLTEIDYKKSSRFKISAVMVFIFFLLISHANELEYLTSKSFKDDRKLQEQLMIVDNLKKLKEQGVTLISCANNFELEYLLSDSANFKNCEQLNKIETPVILVSYFTNPIEGNLLRVNYDEYNARSVKLSDSILARCQNKYLTTENYSLRWCQ